MSFFNMNLVILIIFFLFCFCVAVAAGGEQQVRKRKIANWLVNYPDSFLAAAENGSLAILQNVTDISSFRQFVTLGLNAGSGATDGEVVDALEHFFWGKTHGLAMELGAADGTIAGESMTAAYEQKFNWKRILVEGDLSYREKLLRGSPNAFIANCPICATKQTVHYVGNSEFVGGILEYMTPNFISFFHPTIWNATVPPGSISSITNWEQFPKVQAIDCIPLRHILKKANVAHINYFILDVEVSILVQLVVLMYIYGRRVIDASMLCRVLN